MSRDPLDEAWSSILSSNLKIGGSGLVCFGALGSEFCGFVRLQIDSTDRCEYSATSVDVFTQCFMSCLILGPR